MTITEARIELEKAEKLGYGHTGLLIRPRKDAPEHECRYVEEIQLIGGHVYLNPEENFVLSDT